MKRLNVNLSDMIKSRLESHSEETGLSQNAIISQALVDYFLKHDLKKNGMSIFVDAIKNNPEILKELMDNRKE